MMLKIISLVLLCSSRFEAFANQHLQLSKISCSLQLNNVKEIVHSKNGIFKKKYLLNYLRGIASIATNS